MLTKMTLTFLLMLPPLQFSGRIVPSSWANAAAAAETSIDSPSSSSSSSSSSNNNNSNSNTKTQIYRRRLDVNKKTVSYEIEFPAGMEEGSKPLKTHLDEINFSLLPSSSSSSGSGFKVGITVDPVKITSLQEVCYVAWVLYRYRYCIYLSLSLPD